MSDPVPGPIPRSVREQASREFADDDPAVEFLSSVEAAKRLGVSPRTVKRLDAAGAVSSVELGGRKLYRFDASRGRLVPGRPTAAGRFLRACELFERGASLPECVRELRSSPEEVRRLWLQWRSPLDATPALLTVLQSERAAQAAARQRRSDQLHQERLEVLHLRKLQSIPVPDNETT